jgi:hypothetical protein
MKGSNQIERLSPAVFPGTGKKHYMIVNFFANNQKSDLSLEIDIFMVNSVLVRKSVLLTRQLFNQRKVQ